MRYSDQDTQWMRDSFYPVIRVDDTPAPAERIIGTTGTGCVAVVCGSQGSHVVFFVTDAETIAYIRKIAVTLSADERRTLLALAHDWHGNAEELLNAAKELT